MKLFLTKQVVDNVEPPVKREYWISDTKIKGFGLRVWRTPNGSVKKAYALRIKGLNGKTIRKTFYPYSAQLEIWQSERPKRNLNDWLLSRNDERAFVPKDITLGQTIQAARHWAQNEVDKINGRVLYGDDGFTKIVRMSLEEEIKQQEDSLKQRIKTYSFSKAKEIQLQRMKTRGVSQSYLDRLDKVFEQCIPDDLKSKNLFAVQKNELAKTLLSVSKISNLKVLRPFIGQILDFPQRYGLRCLATSYNMRQINTPDYGEVCSIIDKPEKLRALFKYLENAEDKWQQAYCLRLYFLMSAPMSKIMAAKWDQLQIYTYTRRSDDSFLFHSLDWVYGENRRSFDSIRTIAFEILVKSREKISKEFGSSEYWFPSPSKRHQDGHIKSTNVFWQQCLAELKLDYVTPKTLRREYHANRYFGLDRDMGLEDDRLDLNSEKMAKLSS